MVRSFPAFLILLLAAWQAALAEKTPDVPPPKIPFVAQLPANAAWTITATLPVPKPDTAVLRQEAFVRYTKTGDTLRREVTDTAGEKSETWQIGTYRLWKPADQEPIISEASLTDGFEPLRARAFPGVSWVSSATYDQPVYYEKQACYHYASDGREAWIACDTMLPLAYTSGGVLHRYAFLPPPSAPLSLPADFQRTWDTAMKIITRRTQLQKDLLPQTKATP